MLLLAGLVQLSPFKRACLDRCRAPLTDCMHPWRVALDGLRRGALSLGSCGLLMLVLSVAGVMSAFAMIALTAGTGEFALPDNAARTSSLKFETALPSGAWQAFQALRGQDGSSSSRSLLAVAGPRR